MLRMRLFPLKGDAVGTDAENGGGGDATTTNYDKRTVEEVTSGRWVDLLLFARIACGFNCVLLIASIIIVVLFENGNATEKYKFRNPLTQTAMVWAPYTNATMPTSPLLSQATCDAFVSRDFYKPDPYVQQITFSFSTVNSRYLLLSALAFGFLFQVVTVMDKQMYYEPFTVGNSHITGYLERSISMPLFVVVLLMQIGMHDVWAVISLMFNAWGSMLFSFFAEVLFQGDGGFITIGASRFRRNVSADTVKDGGGFLLYRDGNVHYHALAMLFAVANYILVAGGMIYNTLLTHSCLSSQPTLSSSVALPVYATVGLYGLLLIGQAFTSYVKDKPSTIKQERAMRIANWKGAYIEGSPNEVQKKELEMGIKNRVDYAVWLEFYYGMLDLLIKSAIFASFFLFNRS